MLDRTLNQFNMQISDEQFAVRRDDVERAFRSLYSSVCCRSHSENRRRRRPRCPLIPVPPRCTKPSGTPVIG